MARRLFWLGLDAPGETAEVVSKQHCIATFTNMVAPRQVERSIDGKMQPDLVGNGDLVIVPVNVGAWSRWNTAANVMIFSLEPTLFAQTVGDAINPDRVELLPHFATPDPLVHQIGLALKAVLETEGAASRLYGESMTTALIVHLMQHYCAKRPRLRSYSDGLPKYHLNKVIEYIQAHLNRDLGLIELANVVQLSPHYFSQLFK